MPKTNLRQRGNVMCLQCFGDVVNVSLEMSVFKFQLQRRRPGQRASFPLRIRENLSSPLVINPVWFIPDRESASIVIFTYDCFLVKSQVRNNQHLCSTTETPRKNPINLVCSTLQQLILSSVKQCLPKGSFTYELIDIQSSYILFCLRTYLQLQDFHRFSRCDFFPVLVYAGPRNHKWL